MSGAGARDFIDRHRGGGGPSSVVHKAKKNISRNKGTGEVCQILRGAVLQPPKNPSAKSSRSTAKCLNIPSNMSPLFYLKSVKEFRLGKFQVRAGNSKMSRKTRHV